MKKKYFIPFPLTKEIDSFRLLQLYDLSDAQGQVSYENKAWLAKKLNVSNSTITRLFQGEAKGRYTNFFSIDRNQNVIQLHNDFKGARKPFIVLNQKDVEFLRMYEERGNFFVEYYCYLKFYCSNSSSDFTTAQFLKAVGRSLNTSKNFDKVSFFNKILEFEKVIKIEHFVDDNERKRNRYRWNGV